MSAAAATSAAACHAHTASPPLTTRRSPRPHSYLIKKNRFYYLPESAASMLVGMLVGGVASSLNDNAAELDFLQFDPETFFFLLLPPIIFEAGYTLKRKNFFRNITTILLFAVVGTLISTFLVGCVCRCRRLLRCTPAALPALLLPAVLPLHSHPAPPRYLTFGIGKAGVVDIDTDSPLEALLFGALISAVDPVATLSIMGSAELNCDPLLYSLVFGESVLNDAVAVVLFRTFSKVRRASAARP